MRDWKRKDKGGLQEREGNEKNMKGNERELRVGKLMKLKC